MQDPDQVLETLIALRHLGLTLSIDDFGTGYSSLSYLKRFPLDKLKVDQSFVKGMNLDPRASDACIVQAVIDLAHNMQLLVVAEGVETAEQRSRLMAMGCDVIQGYNYGRPVAAHLASDLLAESRVPRSSSRVGLLASISEVGGPPSEAQPALPDVCTA